MQYFPVWLISGFVLIIVEQIDEGIHMTITATEPSKDSIFMMITKFAFLSVT